MRTPEVLRLRRVVIAVTDNAGFTQRLASSVARGASSSLCWADEEACQTSTLDSPRSGKRERIQEKVDVRTALENRQLANHRQRENAGNGHFQCEDEGGGSSVSA